MKIRLNESDLRYMIKEVLDELMMNELTLSEPREGAEPVCMFVGRFQPFTNGHLACAQYVRKELGMKTFILPTHGNGKQEKPIMGPVQDKMLEKVRSAHSDLIAGVEYGFGAKIDSNVELIRNLGYEPVAWITGSDHEAAYKMMVERYGKELKLDPNFRMVILGRDPEDTGVAGVSATKVRDAIMAGNKEEFARMMPNELLDMFEDFRNCLANMQVKPNKRS